MSTRTSRRTIGSALLIAVLITAASCTVERGQIKRLRKLAATLPVPDGTELVSETFESRRPNIFDPEEFHGTLSYKTRADVSLREATEKVIAQFEASGWTALRQDAEFVDENPVAHRAAVRFEKAGNAAMAYLHYDVPLDSRIPVKVPARAWVTLSVAA